MSLNIDVCQIALEVAAFVSLLFAAAAVLMHVHVTYRAMQYLVIKGPVQSGLFPKFGRTGTGTGPPTPSRTGTGLQAY